MNCFDHLVKISGGEFKNLVYYDFQGKKESYFDNGRFLKYVLQKQQRYIKVSKQKPKLKDLLLCKRFNSLQQSTCILSHKIVYLPLFTTKISDIRKYIFIKIIYKTDYLMIRFVSFDPGLQDLVNQYDLINKNIFNINKFYLKQIRQIYIEEFGVLTLKIFTEWNVFHESFGV